MKFIADVMLGRLAKRLRLLGFDVVYDRDFDDNQIIRLSLEQQRVIVTRDKALSERPLAANHLFIRSQTVDEQLNEFFSAFPIHAPSSPLSRCSECNERLSLVARADAKDLIPDYVYDRHEPLYQCENCRRVYWTGTHVRRMKLKETGEEK